MKRKILPILLVTTLAMGTFVYADSTTTNDETTVTDVYSDVVEGESSSMEVQLEFDGTGAEPEVVVRDENGDVLPYISDNILVKKPLTDAYGRQSEKFTTTKEMPYYKIWINNTSTHDYYVQINKGSTTGELMGDFYAPAGKETTYQADTGRVAETDYVTVMQTESYPLKGTISIKIATDVASLG